MHADLSRKHGGTGLGLAITKSIIESMDGTVKCISQGQQTGSLFRIDIPAVLVPKEVLT